MFSSSWKSFVIVVPLLVFAGCFKAESQIQVREATHADGLWYPDKASELRKTVDAYLDNVKEKEYYFAIQNLIMI